MSSFKMVKNRDSIMFQLRVTFAVLIVVPIIILGLFSYFISKNNIVSQTITAMTGNADVISYGIENNIKKENDVVKFFSYKDEFRRLLERSGEEPDLLKKNLKEDIEPLIWYYISSDENIESIKIYSDYISEDHIGEFVFKPSTEMENAWYEQCHNEYGFMWVNDREGGVYIVKALLDAATSSKTIGMVVLEIDTDAFFSAISQSEYLNNGIVILDENSEVITHKAVTDTVLDKKINENILKSEESAGDSLSNIQRGYYIIKSNQMSNGWHLYYYIDKSEIATDILKILSAVLVIAIVLFAASYITASKYAGNISGRIENLNNMAKEVTRGEFNVKNLDHGKDEIHEVSDSMLDMAKQLSAMVEEINRRNEQDILAKESDIHYREWLFDFVVEKNNDILAVLNGEDYAPNFITSNAEQVLGVPMEDLEQDIRNLSKAQRNTEETSDSDKLDQVITSCMENGEEHIIDELWLENTKTNEHLYYRGVVVSTIDDGGRRLAIALYDRTQEFVRNHQLQEALNAAETANKAKTSFLANMSHDFRTPMNAITGFNLLIDKHAEEPEKVREYTHKISLASQNLLSLLNDVLDMSKIESGKTTLDIREMPIGLLLEEINSVISFQAKAKNQEYILKVEALEHEIFMGDKKRINEILMNILGNAVKYTPEGGKIEFTIAESSSSSAGFQNVRFTVKDNGIGMKPEYKDKIFDAFSREEKGATKTIQGTGLGMAITKSLVELMGGTIRVESEEGKGSTFVVNLRLKAVENDDNDFWISHGIYTFMVVNKDEAVNEIHRQNFGKTSLVVTCAFSGFDALKAVDDMAGQNKIFDMILVDETIDDMTPAELIKGIRAKDNKNNSLIIAVTDNYDKNEDALRAAGCNEILQKPVFSTTLKQAIDDLLKKSAPSQEEEKNPLEGMRFLAAEDNDINADILTELMSMEGATVTRGVNGQEVVEMFKNAHEGDYDMILMDIQMPIMNGYEAAAAIRALGTEWSQRIPIIAMTANAYADDVQQAFDAGMNAHVTKPIDVRIVEKTILEFKGK